MSIPETNQSGSGCALGGIGCGCLGCGGSMLAILALIVGFTWFFILKPINEFAAAWQPPAQTQTQNNEPPALPEGSANTDMADTETTNDVIANQPLTKTEIEQFVRVRRDVRQAFGDNFAQLENVLQNVETGQSPDLWQMIMVARNVTSSVSQARQAQAQALAREKLSLEQYKTIRSSVNRVLVMPNFDFSQVVQDVQNGVVPDLDGAIQEASTTEQELIAPFKQELERTAALGLLGL